VTFGFDHSRQALEDDDKPLISPVPPASSSSASPDLSEQLVEPNEEPFGKRRRLTRRVTI
jgi:hypothetical protein